MPESIRIVVPIGYQCDNCKWIHSVDVVNTTGSWYVEKDGVIGNFWVCPNCERAEKEFREKTN